MFFFPGLVEVIDVTAFRMSQRISGLFGIGTSCVKYPIWNVYIAITVKHLEHCAPEI